MRKKRLLILWIGIIFLVSLESSILGEDRPKIFVDGGLPFFSNHLDISSNGKLAMAGTESEVKFWEIKEARLLQRISIGSNDIAGAFILPDSENCLTLGRKGDIAIWEIRSGKQIKSWKTSSHFFREPENPHVYLTGYHYLIIDDGQFDKLILDTKSLVLMSVHLEIETGKKKRIILADLDTYQVLNENDITELIYDPYLGVGIRSLKDPDQSPLLYLVDGSAIYYSDEEGTLVLLGHLSGAASGNWGYGVINLKEKKKGYVNPGVGPLLRYLPDKPWMLVTNLLPGDYHELVELRDKTFGLRMIQRNHELIRKNVSFSFDGRFIFTIDDDRINIFSSDSLEKIGQVALAPHESVHPSLSFNGQYLIYAGRNGVTIMDVQTGKVVGGFNARQTYANKIFNDRLLTLNNSGNRIFIWDMVNGSLKWAAEKADLLTACKEWEVPKESYDSEGKLIITGEAGSVDGRLTAQMTEEGEVKIIDSKTNKELARLIVFGDGEWLALTPEGFYNCSANGDKYLYVDTGNGIARAREYYGLRNFRKRFFRPDLVRISLSGKSISDEVEAAYRDLKPAPVREIGEDKIKPEYKRLFHYALGLVTTARSRQQLKEAVKEFQELSMLAPDWPEVFYNAGLVCEMLDWYDQAAMFLKRYLDLSPDALDAEEVRARINSNIQNQNKLEEAKKRMTNLRSWQLVGLVPPVPFSSDSAINTVFAKREGKMWAKNPLMKYSPIVKSRMREWVQVEFDGRFFRYFYESAAKTINGEVLIIPESISGEIVFADGGIMIKQQLRTAIFRPAEAEWNSWEKKFSSEELDDLFYPSFEASYVLR
jgi:WD40 repeat protein